MDEATRDPYRTFAIVAQPRAIATSANAHAFVFDMFPILLGVATFVAIVLDALVLALVMGFLAAAFGITRLVGPRSGRSTFAADHVGLRLRCAIEALQSPPSTSPRCDLVIPWTELHHVVAAPAWFGDTYTRALVIATHHDTIIVRAAIFAESPEQIVERVHAAQAELAPASADSS
ncbi:MAG TPA: hypothetical protein VG755_07520 [Nannocystaceae bacterium]|nr:hypothetical protein [Nannocystaceae bacterium]